MLSQALFSLSQSQRRDAHEYKRWSLEAEKNGNMGRASQYRKRSDYLWQSAKQNLHYARVWDLPASAVAEWKEAAE